MSTETMDNQATAKIAEILGKNGLSVEELLAQLKAKATSGGVAPSNGTNVAPVPRILPSISLNVPDRKNERTPYWYLENSEDLEGVTNESTNEAVGVVDIVIYGATEAMRASGMLGKVNIVTPFCTFYGIIVVMHQKSTSEKPALKLQLSGRWNKKEKDAPNRRWLRDYSFAPKMHAQVLRYLHQFIVANTPLPNVTTNEATDGQATDGQE